MTIGSVLLGFALLILVALFLARPFLAPERKRDRRTKLQTLLAEKELFLDQIKSLDFDYETGKLPEEVYRPQRAYLLAETSTVLQKLDGLGPTPVAEGDGGKGRNLDEEIEAAIARYRKTSTQGGPANGSDAFCSQCGRAIDPGDKFCAACGHKIRTK